MRTNQSPFASGWIVKGQRERKWVLFSKPPSINSSQKLLRFRGGRARTNQTMRAFSQIARPASLEIGEGILMRMVLIIIAAFSLSACGPSEVPPKGDRGDVGPAGPAGPPGPPGENAKNIRIVTAPCSETVCALGCNEDERILNAYALNPGGTLGFEDERHVTFRPRKTPAVVMLACLAK